MGIIEFITREDLRFFKAELLMEFKKILNASSLQPEHKWMKSCEVRKMLRISAGTLQNLRINGTLSYTRVGKTLYYKTEDINRILEANRS